MTQEKIIHFIKKSGEQIAVHRIPSFATMKDEFDYYQLYWADAATAQLYIDADFKMEFLKSNPAFVIMEALWLVSETVKLCDVLLFSVGEKEIMLLIMLDKSVKEIGSLFLDTARTTISSSVSRMNVKANILYFPSAKKLKLYFHTIIYA